MQQAGPSGTGDSVVSRRQILCRVAAGAACLAMPGIVQAAQTPFRFGLTPVFLSDDFELLQQLKDYFSAGIGGPVELVSRRTYQEITALLVSGQIHSAWICGFPYVQYRSELELVATPSWRGQPLYQSYLITSQARSLDGWQALRGDIHAYSDPNSNSGFLVTRALLAESGLPLDGFFLRTFFTYGHRNVIRAVASGLAASGSVDGYVWEVMREIEPDLVNRTQVVRRSEWLGFPPVAAPKSLSGDPRLARFRGILTGMQNDEIGRRILKLLRLDAFIETRPGLFDPIAAKVALAREGT